MTSDYSLFYYSNNAISETWTNKEFAAFKITDSIQSRVSCLEISIPDPVNVNASLFFKYQRVKIVEQQTGSSKVLFLGRVDEIVPVYDSDYGQIIKLTCRDYLAEFVERALDYNYTAALRSVHVNTITGTGAGGYASTAFTRSITASGSSSTVARDTRNGQLTPLALIEEFAAEDPWTNSTWNSPTGAVWRWEPSSWTNNTVEADSSGGTPFAMFSSAASYRYFGRNNPFGGLEFDLATNGSYGSIAWEYWNSVTSAWTALNVTLVYTFTADGIVLWDIPAEWNTRTITNGDPHSGAPPDGTSRYWVRAKTVSIVTDATINSIVIVQGNGYDYYIDWSTSPQTIYYYRRGSLPANGPRTNGLTIEYAGTESDTVRAMTANYSFYEIPRELITRVTARGVDSTGTNVTYTETNAALETEVGMVKEHLEYMYGSVTTADCQVRAQAILYNKGRSSIKRGAVSFFRAPYYVITGTTYILRAGQLVRVKCSPRSLDEDFLCIEVVYAEPECVTSLNLLSNSWGRGCGVTDLVNNLIQLRETGSLSTARIGDLIVGNAAIASCSITKLTIGTLGEMGTIGGEMADSRSLEHWMRNFRLGELPDR